MYRGQTISGAACASIMKPALGDAASGSWEWVEVPCAPDDPPCRAH